MNTTELFESMNFPTLPFQARSRSSDKVTELLYLINKFRVHNGLDELEIDKRLMRSAQAYSEDMAKHNRRGHAGHNGEDFTDRIFGAGWPYDAACGENLAYGFETPEQVLRGWLSSPSHLENILRVDFTHIGIGWLPGWWTTHFGGE